MITGVQMHRTFCGVPFETDERVFFPLVRIEMIKPNKYYPALFDFVPGFEQVRLDGLIELEDALDRIYKKGYKPRMILMNRETMKRFLELASL